jgi:phosphoribosyl 1,2-cyclic phosphate phosphodiesterase
VEIILLGTGSSTGTPVIGCHCPTCLSTDPRNKRTRCAAAVVTDSGETLLIDSGPDLRLQALRENICRVDAVLYTHAHADHLNGIDDLRNFCHLQKQAIPIFANETTLANIQQRFASAFIPPGQHWNRPVLTAHNANQEFTIGSSKITPIPVMHGRQHILGYRINNSAYVTDVSSISDESMQLMEDMDVLLLDCLHYTPHNTHFHLEKSIEMALAIGARRTYLIHMTHQMEYISLRAQLPDNIEPGYDGLRLKV